MVHKILEIPWILDLGCPTMRTGSQPMASIPLSLKVALSTTILVAWQKMSWFKSKNLSQFLLLHQESKPLLSILNLLALKLWLQTILFCKLQQTATVRIFKPIKSGQDACLISQNYRSIQKMQNKTLKTKTIKIPSTKEVSKLNLDTGLHRSRGE